ncbi:response regulator transcription factor [Chloroflexi bacterium TSY]|nr:response regulator transcription factor [Chloroflexi bacterium TSY]
MKGMSPDFRDASHRSTKHRRGKRNLIRVMIVEDHPLLIQGLCRVIEAEKDMEVVAEVVSGEQAIETAIELQPDIILMDINLPEKNGLQATREIRSHSACEDMNVIILTAYNDDEQLFHALRAGASAYYQKDVRPSELLPAIRAVANDKLVIKDQIMSRPQAFRWLIKQIESLTVLGESPDEMFAPLSP